MKTKWWIGCSGFHYKHWKEVFYPKELAQKRWFEFYVQHFNTLELNTTFYRFPRANALEEWYARTPADFRFSVKVHKGITHYKQFNDTQRMLGDFYELSREGLKDKLGCILFQLPPRTKYTVERLQKIVESLDPTFNNVLEFRHESWWIKEVYDFLKLHNVSFCGMSHPDLPDEAVTTAPISYYRFHGVPWVYKSQYSKEEVGRLTKQIKGSRIVKEGYFYFNNDIDASAIANAKELQLILTRK